MTEIYWYGYLDFANVVIFFSDAGIPPAELPYKDDTQRDAAGRDVLGVPVEEDAGLVNKFRKISTAFTQPRRSSTTSSVAFPSASNRIRLESVTEKQDSVFEDTATNSTTTSSFNEVINVENETAKLWLFNLYWFNLNY